MPSPLGPVRWFESLDSTNEYLLDEARRGAAAGLVVAADYQRAGRGRLGRRWEAPPGGCLLVSVLLRPVLAVEDSHLAVSAVALAAVDACARVAGVVPGLKWPNDLVVQTWDGPGMRERKLAGVLAELEPAAPGGPPGSVAVVVGIGINVAWSGPPGVEAVGLEEVMGQPVDRHQLLDALLVVLAPRVGQLDTPIGRAVIAGEVGARTVTLGRRVRVLLPEGAIEGLACQVTDAGHLVVETADGTRRELATGDVVHVR